MEVENIASMMSSLILFFFFFPPLLQVLRKEFDLLKDKLLKAEAVTQAARKIFNDENVKLKELQSDFKAADGIRQEAFAHLQNLKKQQYEKVHFFL